MMMADLDEFQRTGIAPGCAPEWRDSSERFWEQAKIAFPGGRDFVWRDPGSHRGRVLADGAALAVSDDAATFDAANVVADGLFLLHFEMPPFDDWAHQMVERADDARRDARKDIDRTCGGESGHWNCAADAIRESDATARDVYAQACARLGGTDALDVAFAGLRHRLLSLDDPILP